MNPDAAAADPAEPAQQQPLPLRPRDVKLPLFWSSKPAAWFSLAESRFRIHNVVTEQGKFDQLLSALPETALGDIMDVLGDAAVADGDTPYTTLKGRLLETHTLSQFEQLELLFQVEPLGGRKPSQLLTAMLQYCPAGEEKGVFFHFLFLRLLPATLRGLLGAFEPGDPRALAARADQLWAVQSAQRGTVAAVDPSEEASVAAVSTGQQKNNGKKPWAAAKKATPPGPPARSSSPSPNQLARSSSGLCSLHWKFGDKARNCTKPCSWGN
jgi:hypothetical protein